MRFLLLLLCGVLLGLASHAEPMQPLLSQAALDSLTSQLARTAADTNRVNLLLRLSQGLLDRHEELNGAVGQAYAYGKEAEQLSDKLHFVSGKVRSLFALGRLLGERQESAGRALIQEGLQLSEQAGNRPLVALGWYYLGDSYSLVADKLPIKLACYQRARQLYQQQGDQRRAAYLLKSIADVHLWQGNSPLAVQELLQVVSLYRAVGYRRLHYTYDLLLIANRQLGNYQAALRDGLATLESARATHDTVAVGLFYSRLAKVYEELNQLPEAMRHFQAAYRNARQSRDTTSVMEVGGHLARLLIRQGQPRQALRFFLASTAPSYSSELATSRALISLAECYVALRDYASAEKQYRKLLVLVRSGLDEPDRLDSYYSVGTFYLRTRQYSQARFYLQKALAAATKIGPLTQAADMHLLLFRADSAQGNFSAAIAHYQRYKALTDSVFSATKSKQIASLQIQYDTRKKEQNIALLTKQNQLQQASLRQREWQRNATLAGAVLLCLLLGVSYNRYRIKQRSNEQLKAKQLEINAKNQSLEQVLSEKDELLEEKEWMLKEIHHRVKNNLQIVSELLDSQTENLHDAPTLAVLRESQNRVQAMALVHQKLYQSRNIARVHMPEYVQEIVDHLLTSFNRQATIRPHLAVAAVELDVALATPLGLILNEAITNALKHAFAERAGGYLAISLSGLADQRYCLTIADDGPGWSSGFDASASRSLGLTMIRGLSKQIDATLTFSTPATGGVCLTLQFAGAERPRARRG